MRKTELKKMLSLILCIVLIAVTALFAAGCSDKNDGAETPSGAGDITVLGEGATSFDLTVVDGDGNESAFTVNTDETTVGAALLALDFIAGEEGEMGLYIESVNGITADYNVDGTYWAFYINGEYATSGVDTTDIAADTDYMLKVEK